MRNKLYFHIFIFAILIFTIPIIVHAEDECISDECHEQLNEIRESFINDAAILTTESNIELTETYYSLSLDEAVNIQASANAPPITSLYANKPAFIDRTSIRFIQPTNLYGTIIDVKKEASFSSETVFKFFGISKIFIKNFLISDSYKNSDVWYEIGYKGKSYYIHASDVLFPQFQIIHNTNVFEQPNNESHIFGSIEDGKILSAKNFKNNMVEIYYQYWRIPKKDDIKKYLYPLNNNIFQFVRLDKPTGVSAEQVNNIIEGKGILDGTGDAFIEAANEHNVNDAYLIAHSILETGGGTSPLANGIEVGKNALGELELVTESNRPELSEIKTTYNMYGIGAVDSCPEECGAIRAYEAGWFKPEDAIVNGAKFVSEQYIYNEFSQNTLYKMKWNPSMKDGNEWKQYATDIGWAEKQTETIEKIYYQLDNPMMTIDVPVFE